jgi:hypothetical protein
VNLQSSTFSGNQGPQLTIEAGGTSTISDSTVASGLDLGINNNGTANITQSTVAFNHGGVGGFGVLNVQNSIIAENTTGGSDCTTPATTISTTIDSDNTCGSAAPFSGVNPNLVQNHNSPVPAGGAGNRPVFPLNTTSVAVNHGVGCPATDERGAPFHTCDIGAVANTQMPQSIAFSSTPPINAAVGSTYTPTASASSFGGTNQFLIDGSSTPGVCTVNGAHTTITFNNVSGTCVIDAVNFGTSYSSPTWLVGVPTQSVHVVPPQPQTVTFTSTAPGTGVAGATYTPTATASSGLTPVTFLIDGSSTAGACTISGAAGSQVVLFHHVVGTCVIDAVQYGNASFQPSYLSGVPTQSIPTSG